MKSLKPWSTAKQCDEAMEDLILMYQVFMSTQDICKCLMNLYHSEKTEQIDATKSIKRKVVYFVVRWSHIATHIFYDQPAIGPFIKVCIFAISATLGLLLLWGHIIQYAYAPDTFFKQLLFVS